MSQEAKSAEISDAYQVFVIAESDFAKACNMTWQDKNTLTFCYFDKGFENWPVARVSLLLKRSRSDGESFCHMSARQNAILNLQTSFPQHSGIAHSAAACRGACGTLLP